jgi:hypothetical protein
VSNRRLEKTARRFLLVLFSRYYYKDQIKQGENGGACGKHGEMRYAYKILLGIPARKRSFRRPKCT